MKLLEASGVCKSFGGIRALDHCSIDVEKGSITGLIGPYKHERRGDQIADGITDPPR